MTAIPSSGRAGGGSSGTRETEATLTDAIDGVVPRAVVAPESGEAVAVVLASAAERRASVVVRGGGTKLDWGRVPSAIDLVLSTRRLDRIVAHEHADLTATVQAGVRIDDLNRELARHGQWLPIESAFDDATIGGAIATNDSGPLRHRYGTPRDLLIGIRLALTDGRSIKSGGNVVKNVAGYDLGKLMSGSFGSLAVVVSATFKLTPLPAASSTLIATFDRAEDAVHAVSALTGSQLEPTACDIHAFRAPGSAAGSVRLLVKFESTPGALTAHVEQARALAARPRVPLDAAAFTVVAGDTESDVWREYARGFWRGRGAVVKASWLPAFLGGVLMFLDEARNATTDLELSARAALGSGLFRIDGDAAAQRDVVERMRARTDLFRHVVVLRADAVLKSRVDVWGALGDAAPIHASVKRAFDPHGILNANRGPV